MMRRKIPGHPGYFADTEGRIWTNRNRNGNSKLDSIDVAKIKQLLTDGGKVGKIAALFSVNPGIIYRIHKRETPKPLGKMRLLKSVCNGTGYQKINLMVGCSDGKRRCKSFYVQRLVCAAFKGEPEECKPICIRNAPRQQPRRVVKNRYLKWGTHRDKTRSPYSHLSSADVGHIRRLYRHHNVTQCELSRRYGVSQAAISLIVNNKSHCV